jgi:hypothetical protein
MRKREHLVAERRHYERLAAGDDMFVVTGLPVMGDRGRRLAAERRHYERTAAGDGMFVVTGLPVMGDRGRRLAAKGRYYEQRLVMEAAYGTRVQLAGRTAL